MSSNNIITSTTSNKIIVTANDGKSRVLTATPIGVQGIKGNTGQDGTFGGPTGPKGDTGNNGNTGISVSGVTLENYNLILTFSDGVTVNVGYIRGETGATGISGAGGPLETLTPSPAGYYPYASIFVDPYGRVTGASGTTDVASQSNIIQIFDDLTSTEINIAEFQTTISQGIIGGTW